MLVLIPVAGFLLVAAGLAFYYLHAPAPVRPVLSADVTRHMVRVGLLERSYLSYVPANMPHHAPLLVVLHGSGQDGEAMRRSTGYAFERLADERGFAVVYPDAFGKNWNDGRKTANHAARLNNVDDKALVAMLVDRMFTAHATALDRVFVFGYSGGGHMAFRLAQETPERIAAIAVAGASLPVPDNSIAVPSGKAVPAMFVNGTADPVNPYDGGRVTLFGFGNRGEVQSSRASADYFARLNSAYLAQTTELHPRDSHDPTRVMQHTWTTGRQASVMLYSVYGGGHVVPQPFSEAPRLMGRNTTALDATRAACDFFGL